MRDIFCVREPSCVHCCLVGGGGGQAVCCGGDPLLLVHPAQGFKGERGESGESGGIQPSSTHAKATT